jgi:hypothetical protein
MALKNPALSTEMVGIALIKCLSGYQNFNSKQKESVFERL